MLSIESCDGIRVGSGLVVAAGVHLGEGWGVVAGGVCWGASCSCSKMTRPHRALKNGDSFSHLVGHIVLLQHDGSMVVTLSDGITLSTG